MVLHLSVYLDLFMQAFVIVDVVHGNIYTKIKLIILCVYARIH